MQNSTPQHERSEASATIIEIESGGPDLFSALEDIAEHPAKKWTAKAVPEDEDPDEWIVSDGVSGVVEYLEERTGDYGPYLMAELRQRSGERIRAAGFGMVLDGWFRILQPGDGLAIMYHGTRPSSKPGNKDYDDFEVIVVRDGRRLSKPRETSSNKDEGSGDLPMPSDA